MFKIVRESAGAGGHWGPWRVAPTRELHPGTRCFWEHPHVARLWYRLKDVSVTQDRDKSVVTLGGHVVVDGEKARRPNNRTDSWRGFRWSRTRSPLFRGVLRATRNGCNSDFDKGIEGNLWMRCWSKIELHDSVSRRCQK